MHSWALAEWALLPLRLFLGITFGYAGLQKLANPNFFKASSTNSIQAQLAGSARFSPLHALLRHLLGAAVPLGYFIAIAEIAIGVGVLFGLLTRIAAIGGAFLSLTLFLVVSFHTSPYYTGADIVFLFAWLPFIIAGSSSRYSLDAWIARRAATSAGLVAPEYVAIAFSQVQRICGNFDHDRCKARAGLRCEQSACPVLLGDQAPSATPVAIGAFDRRKLVLGASAAAVVGVGVLAAGAATDGIGRLIGNAKPSGSGNSPSLGSTSTTSPTTTIPPTTTTTGAPGAGTTTSAPATTTTTAATTSGTLLGKASQVAIGKPATFTIPSSGDPGIVFQLSAGKFVAYDTVCPHAGCTVGYSSSNNLMVCPCHGSEFLVKNGDVINGPAPHGLTEYSVVEGSDGNLYLQ